MNVNGLKVTKKIIMSFFKAIFIPALMMAWTVTTASAATLVSAEGTYDADQLILNIYAQLDTPVVSQCIKVTFNPDELSVVSADKNQSVWYFGDSSTNYPYKDPEISADSVVILGGKLDTSDPTAGVSGDKVLLGTITFTRATNTMPVSDPESLFGITVSLGKDRATYPNYVNFASTTGEDLDSTVTFSGVSYAVICNLQADINGDGTVNLTDFLIIKTHWLQTGVTYEEGDINGDGTVNLTDFLILKNEWLQSCN